MDDDVSTEQRTRRRFTKGGTSSRFPRELPEDLLREAAGRLATVSLILALVTAIATVVGEILDYVADGVWFEGFNPSDWIILGWIVGSSVLMTMMARIGRFSSRAKLDWGRLYQILLCFGFAMMEYWGRRYTLSQLEVVALSWVSVIMVFFAVVVPSVPGKALGTAIASAATVPATVARSVQFG